MNKLPNYSEFKICWILQGLAYSVLCSASTEACLARSCWSKGINLCSNTKMLLKLWRTILMTWKLYILSQSNCSDIKESMLQFTDQMSTSKIKETSSLNKSVPATTILMQSKHIYVPFSNSRNESFSSWK